MPVISWISGRKRGSASPFPRLRIRVSTYTRYCTTGTILEYTYILYTVYIIRSNVLIIQFMLSISSSRSLRLFEPLMDLAIKANLYEYGYCPILLLSTAIKLKLLPIKDWILCFDHLTSD